MAHPGTQFVQTPLPRPAPMVGGPMVLLAMVLLVTAGGLTSTSVVRPVHQAPALAALAFPVHGVTGLGVGLDDRLPNEIVLVQRAEPAVLRSETIRLGDERLNLPPPLS
ncbi:MAG: hypothetical protein VX527_08500 [Planctomycetota bacterium]|nr:hypothetical protein [Planctomycetota bacterium]